MEERGSWPGMSAIWGKGSTGTWYGDARAARLRLLFWGDFARRGGGRLRGGVLGWISDSSDPKGTLKDGGGPGEGWSKGRGEQGVEGVPGGSWSKGRGEQGVEGVPGGSWSKGRGEQGVPGGSWSKGRGELGVEACSS